MTQFKYRDAYPNEDPILYAIGYLDAKNEQLDKLIKEQEALKDKAKGFYSTVEDVVNDYDRAEALLFEHLNQSTGDIGLLGLVKLLIERTK